MTLDDVWIECGSPIPQGAYDSLPLQEPLIEYGPPPPWTDGETEAQEKRARTVNSVNTRRW